MIVTHTTAEGRKTSVNVHEATIGDKLHRGTMMQDSIKQYAGSQSNVLEGVVRYHVFPTCAACSTDLTDSELGDISPDSMTFEQFAQLPEQFVEKWVKAAFDLNPGWRDAEVLPRMRPSAKHESTKSS